MSWLFPSALVVGALAVAAVVALHFIARSEPRPEEFPTARFIPQRAPHARSRSIALSDVLLLLLRAAAVLAFAAAVAGPVYAAARGRVLRIVAIDRSRDVGRMREALDSARALVREGDVLIAFDTAGTLTSALDSLRPSAARGSLSVALAAAIGTAPRVATQADSIDLVIVSPFVAGEIDAATLRMRRTWPGRIRLVSVAAAPANGAESRVEASGSTDDPVIAALSLAGLRGAGGDVRVVRTPPTSADSTWARDSGHVLVYWPASGSQSTLTPRAMVDTVGAVAAGDAVVVAPFARPWLVRGTAVARWVDGDIAAAESMIGGGCVRQVAIPVDAASDVALRPAFRSLLRALVAPCGGRRSGTGMAANEKLALAGNGALASTAGLLPKPRRSAGTPWLLALGALLLVVELGARRMRVRE